VLGSPFGECRPIPIMPLTVSNFVRVLKDYWFLVTLGVSAVASVAYMLLFQVTPVDAYVEIKKQREEVIFHNAVAFSLLEQGRYELAKAEFDKSLAIRATDYTALSGRYLAELFLDLQSPEWDPAVGLAIRDHLSRLRTRDPATLSPIVEKYLGDVEHQVANDDLARQHYEKALELKPNYGDALFTYGWFNYSDQKQPNLPKMEQVFRRMTELDPYDYRGFHGLGYALYMQAVADKNSERRWTLLTEAAQQCSRASILSINRLNVVTDFGEIARCVVPSLSLFFHQQGLQILNDPLMSKAKDNVVSLGAQLLTQHGYVSINGADQKRAWLTYQLALDHLALARQGEDPASHRTQHDLLKKKASELDPRAEGTRIADIYDDQLAILNGFLPETGSGPAQQPERNNVKKSSGERKK
jgi:tetratricopeptide (TPR) repeat protein